MVVLWNSRRPTCFDQVPQKSSKSCPLTSTYVCLIVQRFFLSSKGRLVMDRPEHHSTDHLKERHARKKKKAGFPASKVMNDLCSTWPTQVLFQTQPWGDCWERWRSVWAFLSATMPCWVANRNPKSDGTCKPFPFSIPSHSIIARAVDPAQSLLSKVCAWLYSSLEPPHWSCG